MVNDMHQTKRNIWKLVVLFMLLLIGIMGVFWLRHWKVNNQIFERNAQDLISVIENLEEGQLITLYEITPFDWDSLYVFEAYYGASYISERMGVDQRYLFPIHNAHEHVIYLYFLLDGELVARMLGQEESYVFVFPHEFFLMSTDAFTPADPLAFSIEEQEWHSSTRNVLRFVEED